MAFNTDYHPGWRCASVLHNRVHAPTIFVVLLKYLALAQVFPEIRGIIICIDLTQFSIHSWPRTDHELSKYFANTITKRQIFQRFRTTTTFSTDKLSGLAQAATARLGRSPLTMWGASKKYWNHELESILGESHPSNPNPWLDNPSKVPGTRETQVRLAPALWDPQRQRRLSGAGEQKKFRIISDKSHFHCF